MFVLQYICTKYKYLLQYVCTIDGMYVLHSPGARYKYLVQVYLLISIITQITPYTSFQLIFDIRQAYRYIYLQINQGEYLCLRLPAWQQYVCTTTPRAAYKYLAGLLLSIYTYVYFQVVVHLYQSPHGGTYVLPSTFVLPPRGFCGRTIWEKGNGKLC